MQVKKVCQDHHHALPKDKFGVVIYIGLWYVFNIGSCLR